jgi:hypothetical protein
MKPIVSSLGINRRTLLSALAVLPAVSGSLLNTSAQAQAAASGDALASWNDGPSAVGIDSHDGVQRFGRRHAIEGGANGFDGRRLPGRD